jgi:hypothetical protein
MDGSGDFMRVSGGGLAEVGQFLGPLYQNHWMIFTIIMVILILAVFAFMFGLVSVSAKGAANATTVKLLTQAEPFACNPGNRSAMCRQTRESLTSSALATGYDADPAAFCSAAGTDSTDPWSYLSENAGGADTAESLSRYASQAERSDHALAVAMQH